MACIKAVDTARYLSPSFITGILSRLTQICHNICGVLYITAMQLNINIQRIIRGLLLAVLVLSAVHIGVLIVYFVIDNPDTFDFVKLVDFDYEANIPTLFSSLILIIASGLFLVLATLSRIESPRDRKFWIGLAIVFLFLGIDEGAKIHEKIGDWFEQFVNAEGYIYYPWVLPYVAVFLVLVAAYFKFYLRLPRHTQIGLFVAAAMFLFGAVVLDMLGGNEADANGTSTIYYSVLYTIEEILEMTGVIVLIRTLLIYMKKEFDGLAMILV